MCNKLAWEQMVRWQAENERKQVCDSMFFLSSSFPGHKRCQEKLRNKKKIYHTFFDSGKSHKTFTKQTWVTPDWHRYFPSFFSCNHIGLCSLFGLL